MPEQPDPILCHLQTTIGDESPALRVVDAQGSTLLSSDDLSERVFLETLVNCYNAVQVMRAHGFAPCAGNDGRWQLPARPQDPPLFRVWCAKAGYAGPVEILLAARAKMREIQADAISPGWLFSLSGNWSDKPPRYRFGTRPMFADLELVITTAEGRIAYVTPLWNGSAIPRELRTKKEVLSFLQEFGVSIPAERLKEEGGDHGSQGQ